MANYKLKIKLPGQARGLLVLLIKNYRKRLSSFTVPCLLSRGGFTLIETIVALTVIVAAVVGPVSLIASGLLNFGSAKNKIVAANLAEEGIELVRELRDNNVLCDYLNGPSPWAWNRDAETGSNITSYTNVGVAVNSTLATNCGGVSGASLVMPKLSASCSAPLLLDPATGLYNYTAGNPTIYTRCVSIYVPPSSPDGDIPSGNQMDIISTVTWNEHGNQKNETLQERLYNWR